MYETSHLKVQIEEKFEGKFLVAADEAYRLSSTILTPYRKKADMGQMEKCFNDAHKKARVVVENTLGILKKRFPCLLYELRCSIEHAQALIGKLFI